MTLPQAGVGTLNCPACRSHRLYRSRRKRRLPLFPWSNRPHSFHCADCGWIGPSPITPACPILDDLPRPADVERASFDDLDASPLADARIVSGLDALLEPSRARPKRGPRSSFSPGDDRVRRRKVLVFIVVASVLVLALLVLIASCFTEQPVIPAEDGSVCARDTSVRWES